MDLPLLITSEKLSRIAGLRFGLSTRDGGVSPEPYGMNTSLRVGDQAEHVHSNRKRLLGLLGLEDAQWALPIQCHSNVVLIATRPGEYPACDGLATSKTGLALAISIADCLPVVLYDSRQRAVALVHAGWRGTAEGIAQRAVKAMAREFLSNAADLTVYLDLKEANLRQLLDVGVERRNVEVSPHCTICEPDLFHSYRRDRADSGRMMAVASLIN